MKKILNKLNVIIITLLIINILYYLYSILSSIIYFGFNDSYTSYLRPLFIITFISSIYFYYKDKVKFIEIIIPVYFFFKFIIFAKFGNVFILLISQFTQIYKFGFNYFHLLNI